MKIIYNNIIPFQGFKATNLFGVLFIRKNASKMRDCDFNHEEIHTKQMKEMFYIPFYIWYLIEWLVRLVTSPSPYRSISFEQEAFKNQYNLDYLKTRKKYSWLKYF